jgi:hypothetical protein
MLQDGSTEQLSAVAMKRVNLRLTETEKRKFIGFSQFLLASADAQRPGWPELNRVREMQSLSQGGLAIGNAMMVADDAYKDKILYVNKIGNDGTVEVTMLALEMTGQPTAFRYMETGRYSVEVP